MSWQALREAAPTGFQQQPALQVSAGNADTIILLRPEHGVVVEATADDTPADKKRKFHQVRTANMMCNLFQYINSCMGLA